MKYQGSKSRIAKHIIPIIQSFIDLNDITNYIEPFCGGCNIIDKIVCDQKNASDNNKYLIALWKHLQKTDDLIPEVSRELYNDVKENMDTGKYENWIIGNVGYLASFNGKGFRGGFAKPGYENTKYGLRYRDYYQEAKRNILKQRDKIMDISFSCKDYKDLNPKNSVIYCDPPYANTLNYDTSDNFDHNEFWNVMRIWSKNNIVLVSELNAPQDFECIWAQQVSRSLNANRKFIATEKLFTYKTKPTIVRNKLDV